MRLQDAKGLCRASTVPVGSEPKWPVHVALLLSALFLF
jgi:hypothetical protein